jgi:hypothetical protein
MTAASAASVSISPITWLLKIASRASRFDLGHDKNQHR